MNGLQPTHTDKLGPKIRNIWSVLGNVPHEYTLIGGTAIALYCGHRESVDVDISCTGRAEHPRRTRERIAAEIGKHKVFQRRSGIVVKFFETPESPKIEIHGTDPWTQKAPRRRADNGLLIAAPSDLAARKLYAMSARDVERDGWDLQALSDAGTDMGAALLRRRLFRLFIGVFARGRSLFGSFCAGPARPESRCPDASVVPSAPLDIRAAFWYSALGREMPLRWP